MVIYLSGGAPPGLPDEIGLMLTPHKRNQPRPTQAWAADNGCFTRPQDYSDDRYLTWLAGKDDHRERCLFATAPDVVGDAERTLERSLPMLSRIRDLGYPAALIGQDGMTPDQVPWDDIDCFFIGGTTEWKLGPAAAALADVAKTRGKWLHMGRVNSTKRILIAKRMGCQSVDGTWCAFTPRIHLPRLIRAVNIANGQSILLK